MIVALRHDIDTIIGGLKGVAKIMEIEDKYDARSSFFVRTVLLKNKELLRQLLYAEKNGWEIGLHLDNTTSVSNAQKELDILKSYGFNIHGVTPHGGIFGFDPKLSWRILNSLDIEYAQTGFEAPKNIKLNIKVLPTHTTLDWYIRKHGNNGYYFFKKDINKQLLNEKLAIILTHPEYFVFSVGVIGTMKPRKKSMQVRLYKLVGRATMITLSPLRIRLVTDHYKSFLKEYKNIVEFMTLYELSQK